MMFIKPLLIHKRAARILRVVDGHVDHYFNLTFYFTPVLKEFEQGSVRAVCIQHCWQKRCHCFVYPFT